MLEETLLDELKHKLSEFEENVSHRGAVLVFSPEVPLTQRVT